MIEFRDLNIGYKKPIVEGINFKIEKNEVVALIGRNGSGKSTLINSIVGFVPILKGEVLLDSKELNSISLKERSTKVSVFSHSSGNNLFSDVWSFVKSGRTPYLNWIGKLDEEGSVLIEKYLKYFQLWEYKERRLSDLSDGERQKVNLVRTLVQNTPIILLDEPTAFLDVVMRKRFFDLLKEIKEKEDRTIIFSSHHISESIELANKVVLFINGKVQVYNTNEITSKEIFEKMENNYETDYTR